MSNGNLSVIASEHYVSKTILCQRKNDAEHISEEVLKILHGEVRTYLRVDFTGLWKWKTKIKLPGKFECVMLLLKFNGSLTK